MTGTTVQIHSITVEPLDTSLRQSAGLESDPGFLAIVERVGLGELVKVHATTDDYPTAYPTARAAAETCGATVIYHSSYGPTVVGADVAMFLRLDPACQPIPSPNTAVVTVVDQFGTPEPMPLATFEEHYEGLGWRRIT
jgi:hypothetical protein